MFSLVPDRATEQTVWKTWNKLGGALSEYLEVEKYFLRRLLSSTSFKLAPLIRPNRKVYLNAGF